MSTSRPPLRVKAPLKKSALLKMAGIAVTRPKSLWPIPSIRNGVTVPSSSMVVLKRRRSWHGNGKRSLSIGSSKSFGRLKAIALPYAMPMSGMMIPATGIVHTVMKTGNLTTKVLCSAVLPASTTCLSARMNVCFIGLRDAARTIIPGLAS